MNTNTAARGQARPGTPAPAVVVIALVLAALLGACGGSSGGSSGTRGQGEPTASATPDPAMVGAPRAGQCRQLSASQLAASSVGAPVVDCSGPHTTEIVKVVKLPESLTASRPTQPLRTLVREECPGPANERIGGTAEQRRLSVFAFVFFLPTPKQVKAGARWLTCELTATVGGRVLALPRTTDPIIGSGGLPDVYQQCFQLVNDNKQVLCTNPDRVLRLTHTLDGPSTKGKNTVPRCKKEFPDEEMVAVLEDKTTNLEPGVRFLGCLSFDFEPLEKYSTS